MILTKTPMKESTAFCETESLKSIQSEHGRADNWYLLYTKPKREDFVSESLHRINIEVYNPKRSNSKKKANGVRGDFFAPLFPCYVFVRFDVQKFFHMIKYTRGVKKIVGFDGSPSPVPEEIITSIRSRESEGVVDMASSFNEGDMVVINNGLFRDFTGVFQKELSDKERVLILLNTLSPKRVVLDRSFIARV